VAIKLKILSEKGKIMSKNLGGFSTQRQIKTPLLKVEFLFSYFPDLFFLSPICPFSKEILKVFLTQGLAAVNS